MGEKPVSAARRSLTHDGFVHAVEARAARESVRRGETGCSLGASAMLATMPSLGRVTQLTQAGELPLGELTPLIAQLEEGCGQVLRKMRAVLCRA